MNRLPWLRVAAIAAGAVLLGIAVSVERAAPAALLIAAASALVFARGQRRLVFVAWLGAGALVQDSARHNAVGLLLNTALWIVPAVALALWSIRPLRVRQLRAWDVGPLLFLALCAFGLLGSEFIGVAQRASLAMMLGLNYGVAVCAYFIGRSRLDGALDSDTVITLIAMVGAVAAVLSCVEWATGLHLWGANEWRTVSLARATSPFANPAVLGSVLGAGASAALIIASDSDRRALARFVASTALVVSGLAVFVTYTRSAIAGWLVAVLAILWIRHRARAIAWVLAFVVLAVVPFAWFDVVVPAAVQGRFFDETNAAARVLISNWSIRLAAMRPVFGWGYGAFDLAKNSQSFASGQLPFYYAAANTSHNTLLTILVEEGFVGLVAFVAAPAVALWRSMSRLARSFDSEQAMATGILLSWLVNAVSIDMRFFSYATTLAFLASGLVLSRCETKEGDPR
jgi:O-antigen ligase